MFLSFAQQEGWRNVTVQASNSLQTAPAFWINFQMVGQVMGILLDDFNYVSSKNEVNTK
jgi:hypothetical protein